MVVSSHPHDVRRCRQHDRECDRARFATGPAAHLSSRCLPQPDKSLRSRERRWPRETDNRDAASEGRPDLAPGKYIDALIYACAQKRKNNPRGITRPTRIRLQITGDGRQAMRSTTTAT